MEDTTTRADVNDTLNDAVRANLQTGVLLLVKEALVTAMYDRRLDRGHRIVLAAIATCVNGLSAKAWPSRETISVMTGLSVKTVSNVISELRAFGYLISGREVVAEANNRRLTVYTFGNVDHETIRRQITEAIYKMRSERKAEPADATQGKFPAQGELQVPRPGGTSPPRGKSQEESSPPRGRESSPPAGRSNSYKGTEDKKAFPDGNDAGASIQPLDMQRMVWGPVLAWIEHCYGGAMPQERLRPRLGKMLQQHGAEALLIAVGKAQRSGTTIDVLNYIEGILRGGNARKPVKLSRY